MADPVTLAMVGAAAGAAMKPKDPLRGAMLGATVGFTGGTALGAGAAGSAAAGTTAAGTAGTAAGTAGTSAALTQPALSYAGGNIANAANIANTANTANLAAMNSAGMSFAGMSPSAANAANVANTAPSFMDKLSMAGKSAYENPMMTAQALNATQGLLDPGQQPPSAPAVPVTARNKLGAYDPMASMDPYKQSVVGGQPISLI